MRTYNLLFILLSIAGSAELSAQIVGPIDLPPNPGISWEIAEPARPLIRKISPPPPPDYATRLLLRNDSVLDANDDLLRITEYDPEGRWDVIKSYEPGNPAVAEYRLAERHPNGELSHLSIVPDPVIREFALMQVYRFDPEGRTTFGYTQSDTEEQWKEWEYGAGSDWLSYRAYRYENSNLRKQAFILTKSGKDFIRPNPKFSGNALEEYQGKYRDPAGRLELHFTQHPWADVVPQSFTVTQFNAQGLPLSKSSYFVDEDSPLLPPLYKNGQPDWEVLAKLGLRPDGHDPKAPGFAPVTWWRYDYQDGLLMKKDQGSVHSQAADEFTVYRYDARGRLIHSMQRDTAMGEAEESRHQIFGYDEMGRITDFAVATGMPDILAPGWDWAQGTDGMMASMFAVPPVDLLHFHLEYDANGKVKAVSRRRYWSKELVDSQEDRYREDGQMAEIRYSDDDIADCRAEFHYGEKGLLREMREYKGKARIGTQRHRFRFWE